MSNFAKRIGVASIYPRIANPSELTFDSLLHEIGQNTGNFMFSNAPFRQIRGSIEHVYIGRLFDSEYINKNFDVLVLPAANWINNYSDWEWLITPLMKLTIPVITIGIGLQAKTLDLNRVEVNDSSMRLVKILSKYSKWISCRGLFTRDWLVSVGIRNVIATGCPSIYMNIGTSVDSSHTNGSVIMQPTRYAFNESFTRNKGCPNLSIFRLAGKYNLPIIFQSEPEEIGFLVYGDLNKYITKEKLPSFADLYCLENETQVSDFLSKHGHVFFDIDDWSNFARKHSGVIGTRLHGCIVALNSDKPAILIPHDSRTQEIANFVKIPTIDHQDIASVTEESELNTMLSELDLSEYRSAKKNGLSIYRQFLEDCDLEPSI